MLKEDLKCKFKYMPEGDNVIEITTSLDDYKAYVVKDNGWYGVALELKLDINDYVEKFENVKLVTKIKNFSNENHKLLELITNKVEFLEQFSLICEDFLSFIQNKENRENLVQNPQVWIQKWKILLGNVLQNEKSYAILAELLAINYLLKDNNDVFYTDYGTHDIETANKSYEVKSTIEKYGTQIHVSSQYQLQINNQKPLDLIFVRLEKSNLGYCILDIIKILEKKGYKLQKIYDKISNMNTTSLAEKYRILESKIYQVNNQFPKIVPQSFVGGILPEGIIKMEYIVGLENLEYEQIDLSF